MPKIKQMLASGQTVRMFGIGQLYTPKFVEMVGEHGGFDALWIDVEHCGLTMKDIELITMAARYYEMDHFVRQPATDYASIMRSLEAGAGGVLASMVQSPAEAEQVVRWSKFYPRGERGVNGSNRDGRFGLTPMAEYVAKANDQTFVGVQIETARAIDAVEEIAAVPDLDLLFVGPADISQAMGVPGDFEHPKCLAAIERIAQACAAANVPWGIVPRGVDYAERMRAWGCRLFVIGFDLHIVHAGIRATKEHYSSFFNPAQGPAVVGPYGAGPDDFDPKETVR